MKIKPLAAVVLWFSALAKDLGTFTKTIGGAEWRSHFLVLKPSKSLKSVPSGEHRLPAGCYDPSVLKGEN
jgi:hypothetical protein